MTTSLPNLHPAIVHLPLALLPAAMLFDLLAVSRPTWTWLDRGAALLFLLAALGAAGAVVAGEQAEEGLGPQPPAVHRLLHEHEDLGKKSLMAIGALALARLFLSLRDRDRPRLTALFLRSLLLCAAGGALFLLGLAADRGGALVYGNGVAVERPAAAPPPP
jgi:uncharacterized membrane protein